MASWLSTLFVVDPEQHFGAIQCVSELAGRSFDLTSKYLGGADSVRVEFTARWPLLAPGRAHAYRCQLRSEAGVLIADHADLAVSCVRWWGGARFTLTLPAQIARHGAIVLKISRGEKFEHSYTLQRLDRAHIIAGLRVRQFELRGICENHRYPSVELHDELSSAEFSCVLAAADEVHREILAATDTQLEASVLSDTTPATLVRHWTTPLAFRGDRIAWDQTIAAAPGRLGLPPGRYALMLHLRKTPVASISFTVRAAAEYLRSARSALENRVIIGPASIHAIDSHGRHVAAATVAEDFRGLALNLKFELPRHPLFVAKVDFPVEIALIRSGALAPAAIWTKPVELPIGSSTAETVVPIKPEFFQGGRGLYVLRLRFADREICRREFTHKPRAEIQQETAERILATIQAPTPRLLVERDGQSLQTTQLFEDDRCSRFALAITAHGFDVDVPRLRIQARMTIAHIDVPANTEARDITLEIGTNHGEVQDIPLFDDAASRLPCGRYVARIVWRERTLGEVAFRVLAVSEAREETRRLILSNLTISDSELKCQCGRSVLKGTTIPVTATNVFPAFTISTSGFNSHLPELKTAVEVYIARVRGEARFLTTIPLTLSSAPSRIDQPSLQLGRGVKQTPGRHRLSFKIGEREIHHFEFEVVDKAELIRRVTVEPIGLATTAADGRRQLLQGSLSARQHRFLLPSIVLRISALAPNFKVPVSVRITDGRTILMQIEVDVSLRLPRIPLDVEPIAVEQIERMVNYTGRTLFVEVHVSEEVRASRAFVLEVSGSIVDFEGKLRPSPPNQPVDTAQIEQTYEDIMAEVSR